MSEEREFRARSLAWLRRTLAVWENVAGPEGQRMRDELSAKIREVERPGMIGADRGNLRGKYGEIHRIHDASTPTAKQRREELRERAIAEIEGGASDVRSTARVLIALALWSGRKVPREWRALLGNPDFGAQDESPEVARAVDLAVARRLAAEDSPAIRGMRGSKMRARAIVDAFLAGGG